jgi:hypothetical protein
MLEGGGYKIRIDTCITHGTNAQGYFRHQNQNAKNIGTGKPSNIGTHLKGIIKTSFQVVPLFLKSFHFRASYITF